MADVIKLASATTTPITFETYLIARSFIDNPLLNVLSKNFRENAIHFVNVE